MIRKYTYGNPFDTQAVIQKPEAEQEEMAVMAVTLTEDTLTLKKKVSDEAVIYGLGQQVRGINKRGFTFESYATDDPVHTENKNSLYGAHNFFILHDPKSGEMFGMFVDVPGFVRFDFCDSCIDEVCITTCGDADIYVVEGEDAKAIVHEFRGLIGMSYIPPKWAFGYQQSRWGYTCERDLREVIEGYDACDMPLEAIEMDIDYMQDYKDFTVNKERFPDLKAFAAELKEKNRYLVPIIDAGVKIQEGYDVYEEGLEKGFFVTDEKGEPFKAAVWPGLVHFPDVLNSNARAWFGEKYRVLMDQGIEGFWNDMCEPAIFYSEKRLTETFDKVAALKGQNLDMDAFFSLKDMVLGLSGSSEDYKAMYHHLDDGSVVNHDLVHNLFGYNMTRAAAEAIEKISPDKRVLLYSRSSSIGAHRYGGIWSGDNCSWWSHILLCMQQLPGMNMCGFLYTGCDMGGFGCNTTEDLLMRFMQLSVFTPLMRNHSAMGTREQEAFKFSRKEDFRNMLRIRYALLPYLYSSYMKAATEDGMMFRPVAFDYPEDAMARQVQDQLMLGDDLMIAPIYTQNAAGRYVYLPEDMLLVRMKSPEDLYIEEMQKGHHYVKAALNELIFFIRRGHVMPLARVPEHLRTSADLDEHDLAWIGWINTPVRALLYRDDGVKRYDPDEAAYEIFDFWPGNFRRHCCYPDQPDAEQ